MAGLAQTIQIVDKSGKVMHTSKHLKNVWKEAKVAYLERKAEIQEQRKVKEERELQKAIKAMSIADEEERSDVSRPHARRQRSSRHQDPERPRLPDRHRSSYSSRASSVSAASSPTARSPSRSPPSPLAQFNEDLQNTRSLPTPPTSPHDRPPHELVRSRTDFDLAAPSRPPRRSYSHQDLENVDMDLAYGDFHPEPADLQLAPKVEQKLQEQEMSSLVLKCKMLLEEANCAQYSVKAVVSHLQSNPDAMAAVALTLAEISNLATKMAPGALALFKTGAPGVFALLAAPEFLIAVGVGVGLTVVMFGGYKIIKKIKSKGKGEKEVGMDEAIDVEELSRIEHWRRGIADSQFRDETGSVISGTSVEGELVTPHAARSMGHLPPNSGKKDKDGEKKRRKHRKNSDTASDTSKGSRRSSKAESLGVPRDRQAIKVKKPSPLRRMFNSKDTNSTAS